MGGKDTGPAVNCSVDFTTFFIFIKIILNIILKVTLHLQLLQNVDCILHAVHYIPEPIIGPVITSLQDTTDASCSQSGNIFFLPS